MTCRLGERYVPHLCMEAILLPDPLPHTCQLQWSGKEAKTRPEWRMWLLAKQLLSDVKSGDCYIEISEGKTLRLRRQPHRNTLLFPPSVQATAHSRGSRTSVLFYLYLQMYDLWCTVLIHHYSNMLKYFGIRAHVWVSGGLALGRILSSLNSCVFRK